MGRASRARRASCCSPLSDAAAAQVVANLLGNTGLPHDVLARIVDTAEGNPLYVEQLLSMLIDRGALLEVDGRWVRGPAAVDIDVPPTIHALLEARLDQLGRAERATVEPAAVIGLEFPQIALSELAPDAVRPTLGEHLATLTRKQFVHLSVTVDARARYRFHHQLVRDTVYNGLLKRARAQLHIGLRALGRSRQCRPRPCAGVRRDPRLSPGAGVPATWASSGRSTTRGWRSDATAPAGSCRRHGASMRAATSRRQVNLFRRAVALFAPEDPERLAMMPDFAEGLTALGSFAEARTLLAETQQAAAQAGNSRIEMSCRLLGFIIDYYSGEQQGDWSHQTLRAVLDLVPPLEQMQAHNELATAWRLVLGIHSLSGRYRLAGEAAERSTHHAGLAGNDQLVTKIGSVMASNAVLGPIPVQLAIEQCERLIADGLTDRIAESAIQCSLAQLRAMNGELDVARDLCRRGRAMLRELGQGIIAASIGMDVALVELHGGDLANAERDVRADYEFLAQKGERYFLSSMAMFMSRLVRDQGRDEEALTWSKTAEEATTSDDLLIQALWRATRAPILARAGQHAEALQMSTQAVELMQQAETPSLQADVLLEHATVLCLAGNPDEARPHIDVALALYLEKGNRFGAGRARALAQDLGQPV